jgi:flagellar hook-length control protein FliK
LNPVGTDLISALPDLAEPTTTSVSCQATDKGGFLEEFLGMLFADTQGDMESAEQLQLEFGADLERVSLPIEEEPPSSREKKEGIDLPLPQPLPNTPVTDPSTGVVLDKVQKIEPVGGVREPLTQPITPATIPETDLGPEMVVRDVKTATSSPNIQKAQGIGPFRWFHPAESILTVQVVKSAEPEPLVQTELGKARPPTELSDSNSKIQSQPVEASAASLESSQTKVADSFAGEQRLPVVPPAVFERRRVFKKDSSAIRVDAPKAGASFSGLRKVASSNNAQPEAAADVIPERQIERVGQQLERQNRGAGTHPKFSFEQQEPSRFSRAPDSKQVEKPDLVDARSSEGNSKRPVRSVIHATGTDVEHFRETAQSARVGQVLSAGTERISPPEPIIAKEMIPVQRPVDFDQILDQIVKQFSLQKKGEIFQLGVRLKPEFLGELRIETIMEADKTMRAVIHAQDPSVKALLEGKVVALVQRFDEVGLQIDKVEIQTLVTDTDSSNDSNKEQQSWGQQSDGKVSKAAHPEDREQIGEDTESDIDDGHIHVFI